MPGARSFVHLAATLVLAWCVGYLLAQLTDTLTSDRGEARFWYVVMTLCYGTAMRAGQVGMDAENRYRKAIA